MPVLTLKTAKGMRRIEFPEGLTLREVLDSTEYRVRSGCRGTGACGLCRVWIATEKANDPTLAERLYLSDDRIASGERLACQVKPSMDLEAAILNAAPSSSWKAIPPAFRYHGRSDGAFVPPSIRPLADPKNPYGVAVDLGTTHITLSVHDLSTGGWLAGRRGMNPQAEFGTDVMTRLTAAGESQTSAGAMQNLVVSAIGDAIADVAVREGIAVDRVAKVVIGGNTAMLALLSGRNYELLLQPAHWMDYVDCLPTHPEEFASGWGIHPQAHIEVLPPLAGFVGSDLVAGIAATGLIDADPGSMLIDFGTNSEIALWDGTRLWVTSAAGGPAFEGCGLSCGMGAEPGAIHQVFETANGRNGTENGEGRSIGRIRGMNLGFATIDNERPRGLCGSGMVDLMACLVRSGKVTGIGRFAPDVPPGGIVLLDEETKLTLTKRDIDVFQRAKGAISAAVAVLLSLAHIEPAKVRRVFVGGAFGHFLNKKNAVDIGLLPDVDFGAVELCGNTALAGCEHLLMWPDSSGIQKKIMSRAECVDLAQRAGFEDFFLQGLYLKKASDCC